MTDTKPKIAAIVAGAVSTAATLVLLAGLIPRLGTGSQKTTVKISVPDIGQKYDQAVAAQAAMLRENYQPAVQAKKLNDGDLIACFDANIPESVVKEIAQRKPLRAVFRDSGFASSPEKINVFEIFKLYMPEDAGDITKRVRVI